MASALTEKWQRGTIVAANHATTRPATWAPSPKGTFISMKPAYLIGGLIFLICAAIGVYYLIPAGPGQHHIFASKINESDPTHAIAFFVVGIVVLIGARFVANSSKS